MNHKGNKELRQTLDDIRTISWLGLYYAHKIRAATALALFRETLDVDYQKTAVNNLQQAALYWRSYAALALSNYKNPLWTNRVGYVDWRETYQSVLYDLTIVGGDKNIPSMNPTHGGNILEAEEAQSKPGETLDEINEFSGSGYVEMGREHKTPLVWTFNAPVAGKYILEFRYINSWDRETPSSIFINGQSTSDILLWSSGTSRTWVWDRAIVDLDEGEHAISVRSGGRILMDHVNVIYAGQP